MRLHRVCAMQGHRHMGFHNWQMQESVRLSHEAEMLEVRPSHLSVSGLRRVHTQCEQQCEQQCR